MVISGKEINQTCDQIITGELYISWDITVGTIPAKMLNNTIGISMVPCIDVAFYKLGAMHFSPLL